jgi:uncharacterized damage-inducible protein DinB
MDTSWTAPAVERARTGKTTGERAALDDWMDYQRATLLGKCAGLTAAQLAEPAVPPSAMTLLGLVRHMADVERWWFRQNAARESLEPLFPDEAEWDVAGADAAADYAQYVGEVEAARAAVADADLDEVVPSAGHHPEEVRNVRWIFLHMIEEYARHNGHADLLRERIDGATGA